MTDIKDMIQKHNDWLSGNPDGKRFIADGMNFSGETFKNANLQKAVFRKCKLNDADFEGANLSDSEMTDCAMNETNFSYSVMSGSDAVGSNLSKALLNGTILCGIRLA